MIVSNVLVYSIWTLSSVTVMATVPMTVAQPTLTAKKVKEESNKMAKE
jgi:hypothetical protein